MNIKQNLTYLLLILILLLNFAVYFLFNIPDENREPLTSIPYLLPPLLASIGGFFATKNYGLKSKSGKAFLMLSIGMLLWFTGDTLWEIFEELLDIDPYPSVADFAYQLAYVFLCIGFFNLATLAKVHLTTKKIVFSSIFIVIVSVLVSYFGIYSAFDPEATILENVVGISYGIGDLILVVASIFIILLSLEHFGGRIFFSWITITLALLFTLIADIGFAIYYEEYETFSIYTKVLDQLWIIAYLLFAMGFFRIGFILKDFQERLKAIK
ncbi:hypothetical protein KKC94_01685 [Patescibacteria group bacterium]|nr:hypothetical protein [Patescibacteria group bacterium]